MSTSGQVTATLLPQPSLAQVDVITVLHALSDPVRLLIVRSLQSDEGSCSSLDVPVAKSTVSHHLRVLREAGLVTTRIEGNSRISQLRTSELEQRFPGLLRAVLDAKQPQA